SDPVAKKEIFRSMYDRAVELFKDPNEGLVLKYSAVLAWLKSHLQGETFAATVNKAGAGEVVACTDRSFRSTRLRGLRSDHLEFRTTVLLVKLLRTFHPIAAIVDRLQFAIPTRHDAIGIHAVADEEIHGTFRARFAEHEVVQMARAA